MGKELFQKKKKFEKGYLTARKRKLMFNIVVNLIMAFAVFLFGLLLNKMQPRNIFSVLAMLFILPIARSFSILIVLIGNKELNNQELIAIEEAVKDKGLLLYSPVFTSKERSMYLDLLVIFDGRILGFLKKNTNNKREKKYSENRKEAKKYLDLHLKNQGRGESLIIYDDPEQFIKAFPTRKADENALKKMVELKESMEYFVV